MWDIIFGGLKAFAVWIIEKFSDMLAWVIAKFVALIPEALQPSLAFLAPYASAIEQWFPLTAALALLTAYGVLALTVIGVRWIKSFIPTIGN